MPTNRVVMYRADCDCFTGDYKKAYPTAKLIAPVSAIERHGDPDLQFEGGTYKPCSCPLPDMSFNPTFVAWGRDPAGTKYGFEDEVRSISHF